MSFPLVTRRLTIRPLTAADGADVYAVFAAPAVMRFWNSAPPADLAEAGEWAAYLEDMQRRLGYAQWRVSERAGDRLVGIAGLQPLDGGPDVEITYALEPSGWGAGYATEAGAAALEFAFTEAGLESVVGIAKPENAASLRVLEKLGLRPLGEAEYWGKTWAKYEVTAADWRAERAAATPPLVTERLELRRFTAADLEPLLDVFGDPEVMRYVGERAPPAARGRRRARWWRPRTPTGTSTASACSPSSSARPGAWWERPACSSSRPARTSSSGTRSRAPPGVAGTRRRRRAPSCSGASPVFACTASSPWPIPPTPPRCTCSTSSGWLAWACVDCYGARMAEHALSLAAWRAAAGPSPARA